MSVFVDFLLLMLRLPLTVAVLCVLFGMCYIAFYCLPLFGLSLIFKFNPDHFVLTHQTLMFIWDVCFGSFLIAIPAEFLIHVIKTFLVIEELE